MKLGVVFPQTEIGSDPGAIREFVQAAEQMGYSHLLAYDHVLGADTRKYSNWAGPYTFADMFHEPLVLFGYLAAVTRRLQLTTAVLVLGQRQTALVAKQAAEVDVLSNGRLRLGVGIGWNHVEYEALGEDFHNRGARLEEQIAVLRTLWTQELVNFTGRWHRIVDAGINPLPVQRPIPIWLGGRVEAGIRRAARLGDGWFPQFRADATGEAAIERFRTYIRESGRDVAAVGLEPRLAIAGQDPDTWAKDIGAWRKIGATSISVNTMNAGCRSVAEHITAIERFKEVADSSS